MSAAPNYQAIPPVVPPLSQAVHLGYLDSLRTFLTVLVIFHHSAIPYGGAGGWDYRVPSTDRCSGVSPILFAFTAVNQTFFMALFFVMSGFLSSKSLQRNSARPWVFLKNKTMRLGVPMIFYTLFIEPLVLYMVDAARLGDSTFNIFEYWMNLRSVRGPVWYLAVLLTFDIIHLLARLLLQTAGAAAPPTWLPKPKVTLLLVTMLTSFFIRIPYPVGAVIPPWSLQPAYLAQYILAYCVGIYMPVVIPHILRSNKPWVYFTIFYVGAEISFIFALWLRPHESTKFLGGWSIEAAFYAVFNELGFYFLGGALFSAFYIGSDSTSKWSQLLKRMISPRYSYVAYIIHPLTVNATMIVLGFIPGNSSVDCTLRAAIVGLAGTVMSWLVGALIVKIPGVGRFV